MRFTDGFWLLRPGVTAHYGREAYDLERSDGALVVTAPTKVITTRGDTLNLPVLSVTVAPHLPGIIRVRIVHHAGGGEPLRFDVAPADGSGDVGLADDGSSAVVRSGDLEARVTRGAPWSLEFSAGGVPLTGSGAKSQAWVRLAPDAVVDRPPVGVPVASSYVHEQLDLGVGTHVYGLGERFGPLIKNGQTVEIWNADGGTSSEQAYKNVPFYLTDRGYGVFVNEPGPCLFEVGSEAVQRVQFSVPGESLEYFVIAGSTPAADPRALHRADRPPGGVPAWSYGPWLSTSFTTDYDEATVNSFLDGMRDRDLPLSVFHFDCFWMREFDWSDFTWDARVFPDPEGMLRRLHERGLKVCVWIEPVHRAALGPVRGGGRGGLPRRAADGSVWQWDLWQAGMGIVDFTNDDAVAWFQGKLRALLGRGSTRLRPTSASGSRPTSSTRTAGPGPDAQPLRPAVQRGGVRAAEQERPGEAGALRPLGDRRRPAATRRTGAATRRRRSASMAETLRGGLSLSLVGFGFWSHDIGGFEGTPDAAVFKRWTPFGLLSSHSRFHGSDSYRVPWLFDDDEERRGQRRARHPPLREAEEPARALPGRGRASRRRPPGCP